ncbi:MAG TPA: ribonuclease T2 [Thermohalobaculum sp.]|nr:ribonuclease T2 [Thermohalobaculum sp.]
MRCLAALLAALVLAMPGTLGAGGRAGEFDYYVLALSWNAAWCASTGDARGNAKCAPGGNTGFVVHGLWPQHEYGWPQDCTTSQRDPSRAETAAMADIMGSSGLAWYEWKKHGRCSGLAPAAYFALIRESWQMIERPPILRRINKPIRLAPQVIEQAFIEANPELSPGLKPSGVTVTCKDRMISEVRICLTKSLVPRACSGSTARDCSISDPLFEPMR